MSHPAHAENDPGKIYVLPNLMTAGNLIFGFLAILKIIDGGYQRNQGDPDWMHTYVVSIQCILGACLCDLLDGRLARLGGRESPFGREFDSLADVVSFGVAPALLVFKVVLRDLPSNLGWYFAGIYLVCGAFRLARFNVASIYGLGTGSAHFTGFPIPAAAGLISSITLFLLSLYRGEHDFQLGSAKYLLVFLMLFLSFMMCSNVEYPSFKGLNLRTHFSPPKFIGAVALLVLVILYSQWAPALLFVCYLLYGFFRRFLSRTVRQEWEEAGRQEESPVLPRPRRSFVARLKRRRRAETKNSRD